LDQGFGQISKQIWAIAKFGGKCKISALFTWGRPWLWVGRIPKLTNLESK